MSVVIHRGYVPGCIGSVTRLHADYYSRHVGFGVEFESEVAREMADFCQWFDPACDGLWLALDGSAIEGCVAIQGKDAAGEGARVRWFITSDRVRGQGVGNALLAAAMDFCQAQGYPRVYLWTFEGLHAARHLYERAGFRLMHQESGPHWGKVVNEQRFDWAASTA
jgi:GNAT superfamily N-acetyltransferase